MRPDKRAGESHEARTNALLVLGGTPPPADWLARLASGQRWWIGVDKGAAALWQAGLLPHYLVGDLDSLPLELQETLPGLIERSGGQVRRYPREKDATDGELALRLVPELARPAPGVILTGVRGGRTSQWLGNLMLLRQAAQAGLAARVEEPGETIWFLSGPQRMAWAGPPGETVNLVPWTDCRGVTLAGLRWPLEGAYLAAGSSRGISNVSVEQQVQVELEQGEMLVVVEHRHD
ncbi:MAG: thiamine diphosphokinase [Limnochordaceae bacterium]|nr:thiamine diphosphokinase [Limnochordaceae bacterium]